MDDTARRFWAQVREDDRRTVLCHPADVDRVREILAAHDMADQYPVETTVDVDPGRILLLDHNAAAAYQRQAVICET